MNDLKSTPPQSERSSFCEYLRRMREARDLSLEDISRTTRIPERSLACLERGEFEKLPADVFVRGFLRSYAGCIGLDAEDTVRRYAACGLAPGPVATPDAYALADRGSRMQPPARASVAPRAIESVPEAAASSQPADVPAQPEPDYDAEPAEAEPVPLAAAHESGKRRRRKRRGRARAAKRGAESHATGREPERDAALDAEQPALDAPGKPAGPSLVIDDDDPEAAEHRQAARIRGEERERDFSRRMFLPPVLLDPDQGSRRGALTLAVIILVIVATITMSYLLRRPSSNADGLTQLEPSRGHTSTSQVELREA